MNRSVILWHDSLCRFHYLHIRFPRQVIANRMDWAINLNKSELRTVKQRSDKNILTFVSKYHEKNPKLILVIKQNWYII